MTKAATTKTQAKAHKPAEHEPAEHKAAEHEPNEHENANPKTAPHDPGEHSNAVKDPHQWTTGGQTMTGAQASYLKTLTEEAGEEFDPNLTKSEASLKIDELQGKTGRGKDH